MRDALLPDLGAGFRGLKRLDVALLAQCQGGQELQGLDDGFRGGL